MEPASDSGSGKNPDKLQFMEILRWAALAVVLVAPVAGAKGPDFSVLLRVPFASGSDQLGPLAQQRLQKALPQLQESYVGSRIEISGHADGYAMRGSNLELSRRRARAVRNWLESNGMDVRFMYEQSHGDSQPRASNETREGRFLNRRVELRLLREIGPGDLTAP